MHEILPDILAWSWFSEPHGYDFNGYLVRHGEGALRARLQELVSGFADG